VRLQQRLEVGAADLLLALDDELQVDRQRALALQQAPHRLDLVEHLALVVDGAPGARLALDDDRLERRRVPQLERVDRLHVVVAVDEDRRRAGAGVQPVAVHGGGPGRLQDLDVLEPGGGHQPGAELGRAADVARVVGMSGDRGDAQPVEEDLDDAVALGLDEVAQAEIGHDGRAYGLTKATQ
jgi:hypothetical protein